MDKPLIVISHELTVESLRDESQKKGIEFVYDFDFEADIKEQIRKIKTGFVPMNNKGQLSRRADLPELEQALAYLKWEKSNKEKEEGYINGTTRQSAIAIYYLQKAKSFPRTTGNKTEDAVFVKFLIGKDFDEIRKLLADPLKRPDETTGKATQSLIKDLTIVLNQFKRIQFFEGVKLVENDIDNLKNDLKTFNKD